MDLSPIEFHIVVARYDESIAREKNWAAILSIDRQAASGPGWRSSA